MAGRGEAEGEGGVGVVNHSTDANTHTHTRGPKSNLHVFTGQGVTPTHTVTRRESTLQTHEIMCDHSNATILQCQTANVPAKLPDELKHASFYMQRESSGEEKDTERSDREPRRCGSTLRRAPDCVAMATDAGVELFGSTLAERAPIFGASRGTCSEG